MASEAGDESESESEMVGQPLIKVSVWTNHGKRGYSVSLQEGASKEEVDRLVQLALDTELRLDPG